MIFAFSISFALVLKLILPIHKKWNTLPRLLD